MNLDTLQADIKVAQKGSTEQMLRFLFKHPFLSTLALIWMAVEKVAKVILWLLIFAGLIVGLKCLWLGTVWLWRLI